MVKMRKVRKDAPERVKEVINLFERYLCDASGRNVQNNSWDWAIHWRDPTLDASNLAMLFDMAKELDSVGVRFDMNQYGTFVTVTLPKKVYGGATFYPPQPHN